MTVKTTIIELEPVGYLARLCQLRAAVSSISKGSEEHKARTMAAIERLKVDVYDEYRQRDWELSHLIDGAIPYKWGNK